MVEANATEQVPPTPLGLDECVEWRQWLWTAPVRWLIGSPERFRGARVLDVGCNRGGMSRYFASLGAFVDAVDVDERAIELGRARTLALGLEQRVRFIRYRGDIESLEPRAYDFVFTKSVLVILADPARALFGISRRLKPDGCYLAAENLHGGLVTRVIRRRLHPRWNNDSGIVPSHFDLFRRNFRNVRSRRYWGAVVAIEACDPFS